jgi:hypothetical protein
MWWTVLGTETIGYVDGGLLVEIKKRECCGGRASAGKFYVDMIANAAMATTPTTTMCL